MTTRKVFILSGEDDQVDIVYDGETILQLKTPNTVNVGLAIEHSLEFLYEKYYQRYGKRWKYYPNKGGA